MTSLTLPFRPGRKDRSPRFPVAGFLNDLADGLREGLRLARRYDSLTALSEAELARLGLRREDIPQAILRGR